ncbi:MAG: hypothetical protein N0E48_04840 [Candidatus Thiodiazotropha endolucinida]|nr:hypothetical protein [Candidatus Thiodiazotropha endolucinida]
MRRKGDCETLLCVLWGAEEQHWGGSYWGVSLCGRLSCPGWTG